ncbi:sigma intracellular receptor 2 [Aplysia californica]|uniref:Sigma intracellular receptor 2 n=1 Tax=Aplysia californica TaxID=6500 RepID=A0ABM0JEX9_APLCA|nr:sigma intracellular receptor 2 [Aplysia californica]
MLRFADAVFCFYFVSHIPIVLLVDLQALLPEEYFPKSVVAMKDDYCREFRDPMLMDPPGWYQSLILCTVFIKLPFTVFALYGYLKGARQCPWLRIPSILYGCHVATMLIPVFGHTLTHDFSKGKFPGPRNMHERLVLIGMFSPHLLLPLWIMLDALFSSAFQQQGKQSQQKKIK